MEEGLEIVFILPRRDGDYDLIEIEVDEEVRLGPLIPNTFGRALKKSSIERSLLAFSAFINRRLEFDRALHRSL
jgi:hypothetical protein